MVPPLPQKLREWRPWGATAAEETGDAAHAGVGVAVDLEDGDAGDGKEGEAAVGEKGDTVDEGEGDAEEEAFSLPCRCCAPFSRGFYKSKNV